MFRLLQHGDSSGEELVQQRRVSQSQPGYNDDWHCDLLTVAAATIDLIDSDHLYDREYQYRPGLAGRRRRRLPLSVAVISRRPHRSRVGSVPARAALVALASGGQASSRFGITESLLVSGERSECGLTCWLVDVDNDAGAGCPGFDEPESDRRALFLEQSLAASQDERVKPEPVLIDKVVLDQRLSEIAAAVDLEFLASLALQPCDLFHGVTLDQRRVVPRHLVERFGDDVLREAIQLPGDLVFAGDQRPVRGHDLVRGSTEQKGVSGFEPVGHEPAHRLVRIRNHPAALLETSAWVLGRAAWALHDPIQGQERRQGHLHIVLLNPLREAYRHTCHRKDRTTGK